jgi:hypothetical protein
MNIDERQYVFDVDLKTAFVFPRQKKSVEQAQENVSNISQEYGFRE